MTRSQIPAVDQSADQLIRGLVTTVARLHTVCSDDAAELRRLRDERQRDIADVERTTRSQAEKDIASTHQLATPRSLGSRLRSELTTLPNIQPKHVAAGSTPASLKDAIAEWSRLAASSEHRVRESRILLEAWNARLIKRSKSAPQLDDSVWRNLDRLDLIHQSVPALKEALVADRIREVATAADTALAGETERRNANQEHLAGEVKALLAAVEALVGLAGASWSDSRWESPRPATLVERLIRLGELHVDGLPKALGITSIPAFTAFPFMAGVAVGSDMANRDRAGSLLRALILRLFAVAPPGRLQIKAVDPVSLGQSVAEFRHLSEYDAQLMDEKTWTSERDIERLMEELSDHLEVVISKYLRGQFATIDEYNRHADEVAQPYRVLVVFDYPSGFTDRASRQLLSLIENGPRCGVYTILHHNLASQDHHDISIERLVHSMQKVVWQANGARLELTGAAGRISVGLVPETAAPIAFDKDGEPETGFAALLAAVGEAVNESHARPPAVTLDTLLPVLNRSRTGVLPDFVPQAPPLTTNPSTWWTALTADSAVAPIGRSGAQGVTSMYFSSTEVAGGAIMVGLPRSGKTTSLHSMILTLSMLYPPDELELYLIDAKHGVEFKVYENLPHARMVSVHSEREFSVAVLKSIEAEIRRRAELMTAEGAGRANLTEFRRATGAKLPRIVVIIDEFHELFEEPDRVGQEAFAAFSNIVRMGPFSGVHIVVASQTLSSMPAMDRPTLMLLPQRVAFMCNEYDAEIVMGDANKAPRLLSKTGEGLFNPARGEESKNQPFQGLYIPTEDRGVLIRGLQEKADTAGWTQRPRVFDGDAVVARPSTNAGSESVSSRLTIALGEPFALADRESVVLRRTRGANLLLLGDGDDGSAPDLALRGVLHSCMLAGREQGVDVTVIDFIGDEEIQNGLTVMEVADALDARYVRSRASDATLGEIAAVVEERTAAGNYRAASRLVILCGLQRALSLKPIDPYADESEGASGGAYLAAILQGGPEVGIHVVISADRAKAVERRIGSELLQEMMLRIAGSSTDQHDLMSVSGEYGDVATLRPGQLLIGDLMRSTATRIRGYTVLTEGTLPNRQGG